MDYGQQNDLNGNVHVTPVVTMVLAYFDKQTSKLKLTKIRNIYITYILWML